MSVYKVNRRKLLFTSALVAAGLAAPGAKAIPFLRGGASSGGGLPALTVEITFPGGSPTASTLVYNIASGTDIGSYTAPSAGFTQRCIRVRHASLANFFVDFRPDTSGGRVEVVFWNGEVDPTGLTVVSGYSRDLPSYTAVVKNAGSTVSTTKIPQHIWGCRWRYQSATRSEIRTRSQIFSQGWLFNMDTHSARSTGLNGSTGKPWSGLAYTDVASGGSLIVPQVPQTMATPYVPFGGPDTNDGIYNSTTLTASAAQGDTAITVTSVGSWGHSDPIYITLADGTVYCGLVNTVSAPTIILDFPLPGPASNGASVFAALRKFGYTTNIDTGGDRPEIGLITEWTADYLINGRASSQNSMYQQAEMTSSEFHFFLSDVQTGACVNQKRNLSCYLSMTLGRAYNSRYEVGSGTQWMNWDLHEGETHQHGMPYVQYALTEDAYYLEALQYLAHWGIGFDITGREGANGSVGGAASGVQYCYGNIANDATGATGINGLFTCCPYLAETRNLGWGIRNIAMCYRASLASPPSWLLPQSYYSAISSDASKVVDRGFKQSATSTWVTFRMIANDSYWQTFEQAYGILGMAFADLVGMPTGGSISWFTQLDYWFDWMVQETNNTSGWNRQVPLIHDLRVDGSEAPFIVMSTKTTWGQLWTAEGPTLQVGATFPSAASPGNQSTNVGNSAAMYAAAAAGLARGATGASSAKAWVDLFIDYNFPNTADAGAGQHFFWKWGFNGT